MQRDRWRRRCNDRYVQLDDLERPLHPVTAGQDRQGHQHHTRSPSSPARRGYAKLKEVKGQLDKISGDAMWVPNAYAKDGLIEPFDINELKVSSQLYSFAREFPYWQSSEGYMAYPFGWSPIMIYYDPAKVTGDPNDWQVLLDPKYKGRVVVENQPEEIVAYMARAAGFDSRTT
jgi:spermidine/putrescine-binding protein